MTRYEQTVKALKLVMDAIVDTVKEAPDGAPEGAVYAALMHFGCSLDTYNSIIAALVKAGKLRKSGHLLYAV